MTLTSADVSYSRRIAQVACSIFFCFTTTGVVFGFAALKPVLVQQGVYDSLCEPGSQKRLPSGQILPCEEQDIKLNALFVLATTATNCSAVIIGSFMDAYGPWLTSLIGIAFFASGNFVFGLGKEHGFLDTYIIGYILLAIGGAFLFLPRFHLRNAFPKNSGLVLSALTGAFDASSFTYVIYSFANKMFEGGISVRTFFWSYLIIPALLVVEQCFLAPRELYEMSKVQEATEPENPTESTNLISSSVSLRTQESIAAASAFAQVVENNEPSPAAHKYEPVYGVLHNASVKDQLLSPWFFALLAFTCVHMTRTNFYIQSVEAQLLFFVSDYKVSGILANAFSVLLPFGGLAGVPLIGHLLDNYPMSVTTRFLLGLGFFYGVSLMTDSLWLQLAGMIDFVIFRPLMYTWVSDAFANVFGFLTFGTLYGTCMSVSGVVGLLNTPLDILTKRTFSGSYYPVDISLVILGAVTSGALLFMSLRASRQKASAPDV